MAKGKFGKDKLEDPCSWILKTIAISNGPTSVGISQIPSKIPMIPLIKVEFSFISINFILISN
jgi:hypothetical protein